MGSLNRFFWFVVPINEARRGRGEMLGVCLAYVHSGHLHPIFQQSHFTVGQPVELIEVDESEQSKLLLHLRRAAKVYAIRVIAD